MTWAVFFCFYFPGVILFICLAGQNSVGHRPFVVVFTSLFWPVGAYVILFATLKDGLFK